MIRWRARNDGTVFKWPGKIAGSIDLIIIKCSMKKVGILVLLSCGVAALLSGCASSGPSPEEQVREQDRQREAERQQADFRKSLPPVANPGQGQ
jgi:hypothetical protein